MRFVYNPFTDNFDAITEDSFPKYFIPADYSISVGVWGQYVIHEEGYLEVAGSIDLDEGAMIIIQ